MREKQPRKEEEATKEEGMKRGVKSNGKAYGHDNNNDRIDG